MSNKILNTYAAYAFDDLIRKQSSSGAIFSLIAEKILSLSGIVYGVTMTDDCKGQNLFVLIISSSYTYYVALSIFKLRLVKPISLSKTI